MSDTSIAVWDVPMPVVTGGMFSIKAGATGSAGAKVEVSDIAGKVVASGTLGDTPLAGTEALFWTVLDVPSPPTAGMTEYTVRAADAASRFSVAAAGHPDHTLAVTITEKDSHEALAGVEIRLGAFHARTGTDGHAELRVCKGDYQVVLWKTAHIAQPTPLRIDGDARLKLTMVHVPEDHPDARWVR